MTWRREHALLAALFLVALALRLAAAAATTFPPTEVSAYYVGVARNVLEGDGLVSDAVWSYATPPLVAPKPAFDLWLPLASFVALPAMVAFGPTLFAAQAAHAVLGAMLAPLACLLGRDAARRAGRPEARVRWIALSSGAVTAVLGPYLVAVAGPDSTTPFALFAVAAAMAVPRGLGEPGRPADTRWGLALGVLLGLAYLSRQEAVFLGAVVLALALRGDGVTIGRRLDPILVGGAAVTLPWLARNLLAFGSLFPGQALENALLLRPTDVFAWAERPTFARFVAAGPLAAVERVAAALEHNVVDVLLVAGAPVGLVGLLGLATVARSGAVSGVSPLRVLVLAGAATFIAITLVFPVATLSGTWLHASGPTLVALTVLASLTADSLVARVAQLRRWPRANAWLAPLALLALAVPVSALQVTLTSAQAAVYREEVQAAAGSLAAAVPGDPRSPAISDHPIWLAETAGRPVLALPDEDPQSLHSLATRFGARTLVVLDERGPYPRVLEAGAPCFEPLPRSQAASLFTIELETCTP